MNLPEDFLRRMEHLLGTEYVSWRDTYDQPAVQGIRINPAKLSPKEWEKLSPWNVRPVLWNRNGYYCEPDSHPSKDVYYYAGLYYIQEPSAMAPAAVLAPLPGQKVLDLCAAPGGKSTELGARLAGQGILIANDISASRAKALVKNLEMAGIANACVTAEKPQKLAETFGEYFDKILVDAPCSGEGMFRKEPDLIKSWQERGPEIYAPLQREILLQASRMLKPGGELVYSTCTFSLEEDEEVVDWFLYQAPEMELIPLVAWKGAAAGMDGKPVIRLFPHRVEGEGHFIAWFRKRGKWMKTDKKHQEPKRLMADVGNEFLEWEHFFAHPFDRARMMVKEEQIYLLPEEFDSSWRLRYLRTGLLLGSVKRGRFEPSQAMAMTIRPRDYAQTFSMKREDERVIRYLKGESIQLTEKEKFIKGWVLVCVEDFPLGWAKASGNGLKNKYYPGWRWQ